MPHSTPHPPLAPCPSPFLFLPASAAAATRISARRRRRLRTCILPGEEGESEVGWRLGCNVVSRRSVVGCGKPVWELDSSCLHCTHSPTCVRTPVPCLLTPSRICSLIATRRLIASHHRAAGLRDCSHPCSSPHCPACGQNAHRGEPHSPQHLGKIPGQLTALTPHISLWILYP